MCDHAFRRFFTCERVHCIARAAKFERADLLKIFALEIHLRTDPFERADVTSNTYYDWFLSKMYMVGAASGIVEQFLATFRDFPPRQKAATFTIDQALEKMKSAMGSAGH